jgi:hypothetical protein
MARLSQDELHQRLRLDYRIAMRMAGTTQGAGRKAVLELTAYRSGDDLNAKRHAITSDAEGHLATQYRAVYHIKTLSGPDRYCDETVVHIDLLANGNYPYSEPGRWVLSRPMPWSPHVKEGNPICIGEIWVNAHGQILLGHLLIHIAKLLNFDEVARGGGYRGWNLDAITFWKKRLNERPITPALLYPALPLDLTHGLTPEADEGSVFRQSSLRTASPPSAVFQRTSGAAR